MSKLYVAPEFHRFNLQMERLWSHVVSGSQPPPGYGAQAFAPPVDIYEHSDSVVVVMELAGVRGAEIDLRVDGQRLTIAGFRHDHLDESARSYCQMEICRGEFGRTVTMPCPVEAESVGVTYDDGMLRLVFAKAARPVSHRVVRRTP